MIIMTMMMMMMMMTGEWRIYLAAEHSEYR